ncbi:MAG: hypothetical protein EXS02_08660 [Planctomycetes bacterium]|nr:hypothetical protein [Planctomycetota bacterium]
MRYRREAKRLAERGHLVRCPQRPPSCAANPCAANPCAANPCAANPCAANPCDWQWSSKSRCTDKPRAFVAVSLRCRPTARWWR